MNSGEKEVNRMAQAAKMSDRRNWKKLNGKEFNIYTPIAVGVICVVWFFAAHMSENNFLFPTLESVLFKTVDSLRDLYVLRRYITRLAAVRHLVPTGVRYIQYRYRRAERNRD